MSKNYSQELSLYNKNLINELEELKPWNTARFIFFSFIRTWCMSIFVVTCIFPIIYSLGNTSEYNHNYLFLLYFLLLTIAVVLDSYMVPKTADQKITIKEIYTYLCTKKLDKKDKFYRDKIKKVQFRLARNCFLISITPIIFFILLSTFTSDRIWFDITLIISVSYFAYFLFYKYVRLLSLLFIAPSKWRPDIKQFLLNPYSASRLELFTIPYLIGVLLYLIIISGLIGCQIFLTLNEPTSMKRSDLVLWSIARYGFMAAVIGYIYISILLTSGLKYIHVAKEIVKRTKYPTSENEKRRPQRG